MIPGMRMYQVFVGVSTDIYRESGIFFSKGPKYFYRVTAFNKALTYAKSGDTVFVQDIASGKIVWSKKIEDERNQIGAYR